MSLLDEIECPSCRKACTKPADHFFIKHRGMCDEEYHAMVAVREAELAASRPPQPEVEEVMLGLRPRLADVPKHSFVSPSNRPPKPPKVYRKPKVAFDPNAPLPLCSRNCGREVERHTHKICKPCKSKEAQERWTDGARQWASEQAIRRLRK